MRHRELDACGKFRASELSSVWAWHARRQGLDTLLALRRTTTAGMRVLQGSQSCVRAAAGSRPRVQLARAACEPAVPCAKARLLAPRRKLEASTSHARPLCEINMAHSLQELDPGGKFSSLSSVWAWRATRQGLDVPLALCCTLGGFHSNCTCAPRLDCSA